MESFPIGTVCRTLTEAYARFGIRLKNPRSAWSAQSDDGRVVLTLWSENFRDAERRVYDVMEGPLGKWNHMAANKRRIEHLKYARAHAGGVFDSIIVTNQTDPTYEHITSREIGPRMRLVQLDERTGRFRAERLQA